MMFFPYIASLYEEFYVKGFANPLLQGGLHPCVLQGSALNSPLSAENFPASGWKRNGRDYRWRIVKIESGKVLLVRIKK
jgi:hypothetical protein